MKRNDKERLLLIGFCKTTMEYILRLVPPSEKPLIPNINFDEWSKAPLEGIRMAVNDMIEWGTDLSKDQTSELDSKLKESGFPTFTAMKNRNYRQVMKILSRGTIKSDTEYYLLNSYLTDVNCEELSTKEISSAEQILAAFEMSK